MKQVLEKELILFKGRYLPMLINNLFKVSFISLVLTNFCTMHQTVWSDRI